MVEKLVWEKIGVKCKVIRCWRSGAVLIVKIENEEKRKGNYFE